MEGDYVNGTVEEQAAPQTLQELQAAGVHAMPVVAGFQEALAAQAAQVSSLLPAAMLPVQLRDQIDSAAAPRGQSTHVELCCRHRLTPLTRPALPPCSCRQLPAHPLA